MKASELGLNPFAPGDLAEAGMVKQALERPKLDPRAVGFTGDVLDQLLEGRWQEGHETGFEDGAAQARRAYTGIFDDGFDRGHSQGVTETGARITTELAPMLTDMVETLEAIAGATGSTKIKDRAMAQVEGIKETIGNLIATTAPADGAGV